MTEKSYVLGTDQQELRRLEEQHQLWKAAAVDVWKRAGFQPGQKLFDLGCGPGFTTLELAKYLGPTSKIHAVDASNQFLDHLRDAAKIAKDSAQIEVTSSYLEKLDLPDKDFDGAYCRWLMIFVPDVRAAIRNVRRHLKPGARFVLQEYIAYETMSLCPEEPLMQKIVQLIFESWKAQGGDPNRGRLLPQVLMQEGFKIKEVKPLAQVVRHGDPLWKWPDAFFRSFLPRLVTQGILKEEERVEFLALWDRAMKEPDRFLMAPTMLDIVAERN